MADLNYSNMNSPYNDNMERDSSVDSVSSSSIGADISSANESSVSSSSEISSPTQLAVGVVSSNSFDNLWIGTFIKSNNYKPKASGFMIDGLTGYIDANSVYLAGSITATSGVIGGFTITPTKMYGGIIQTASTVGIGSTGVIMDSAGLRGYDSVLGNTFNLPTDGSAPSFSSGVINSTIFEINTNAVLRTSVTVGDGSVNSAGILINNTGFYACQASQTLANANVKILINGNASFAGSITSSTINIPNITSPLFSVDSSGNVSCLSLRRKDFHWYTVFESIDGWSTDKAVLGLEGVTLTTTASLNNIASFTFQKTHFIGFSWDKKCILKYCLKFDSNFSGGAQALNIGRGSSNVGSSDDNAKHYGFRVINETLYASCGDNTAETKTSIGNINSSDNVLYIDYDPGVNCKFYLNDTLVATINTNLPSGTSTSGSLLNMFLQTQETVAKSAIIYYADFWQAI